MNLFIWLGFYFTCVYLVSRFANEFGKRKLLKILFLPGVALYALARSIGCLLSLSSIEKIEFLSDKKPFLAPGRTPIPYAGPVFSALGTHAVLLIVFFYAHSLLPVDEWSSACLPGALEFKEDPAVLCAFGCRLWECLPFHSLWFWIALYVAFGVALSFDLRLNELTGTLCVAVVGAWICGLLAYFGVGFAFLSRGWFLSRYHAPEWFGIASVYFLLTAASGSALLLYKGTRKLVLEPLRGSGQGSESEGSGRRSKARRKAAVRA